MTNSYSYIPAFLIMFLSIFTVTFDTHETHGFISNSSLSVEETELKSSNYLMNTIFLVENCIINILNYMQPQHWAGILIGATFLLPQLGQTTPDFN